MVFTIYALADGATTFYVGLTSRTLSERLGEHVRDARRGGRRKCRAAPAAIAKMETRPTIRALASATDAAGAKRLEDMWIDLGLALEWPLVNCRPSTR